VVLNKKEGLDARARLARKQFPGKAVSVYRGRIPKGKGDLFAKSREAQTQLTARG